MSGASVLVRHWLKAAVALAALVLAAYVYYYLTHIPAARTPRAQEKMSAVVGRALLLDGLASGPAFSLNVRGAQRIEVQLSGNARLMAPSAADLVNYPLAAGQGAEPGFGARQSLLVLAPPGGNAQIDFEVEGDRPGLIVRPEEPPAEARAFALTARHGRLVMRVAVNPAEGSAQPGDMIYRTAREARRIDRVAFAIPDGDTLELMVRPAPAPAATGHAPAMAEGAAGPPVLVELPIAPAFASGASQLAVGAAAVGVQDGDDFAIDAIACAAPEGRTRLWRSPLPAIGLDLCRPAGLAIDHFDPLAREDQLVLVSGQMFRSNDGAAEYWRGPSGLPGNVVISGVTGGLMALFLKWAGSAVRGALGGNTPPPSTGRRRGKRP